MLTILIIFKVFINIVLSFFAKFLCYYIEFIMILFEKNFKTNN